MTGTLLNGSAAGPRSLRRRVLPITAAVAAVVLLSGCQDDTRASGSGIRAAGPVTTTAPPAPVEATNLQLPRTISYIGVEYTVTKVTLHATDPLYDVGPSTAAVMDLDRGVLVSMTAKNTTKFDLEIPKAALSTGPAVVPAAIEPQERESTRMIQGGNAMEVRAFFRTDLADVSTSSLSIREEGRVPVTVPLTGAVPETGYPVTGTMGGTLGPAGVSIGSATLKFDVTGIQTGLDALPVYPERAELGHRIVVLSGRVKVAKSIGSPGIFSFGSDLRLVADDLSSKPSHCTGDQDQSSITVAIGEVVEWSCAFAVKDSASGFAVSAGYANARTGGVVSAPITMGPLPPAVVPSAT